MNEDVDIIEVIKIILEKVKSFWKMIIVISLIFCISAYFIGTNIKPTFQTTSLLYLNGLSSNTTTCELINELVVSDQINTSFLEEKLQLSAEIANSVVNIDTEIIEHDPKIIRVELTVNSVKNIPAIEKGLLYYLDNNTLLKRLSIQRITRYQNTINKINLEQSKADSIWNSKGASLNNYGDFFGASLRLEDLKNSYLNIIACENNSFSYLKPFLKKEIKINSVKPLSIIFAAFILSIITSAFIIILIDVYKKITL